MTATTRDTQRTDALRLVAQGTSNRETARLVGVSEATVRRWRTTNAPDTPPDQHNSAPNPPHDAPTTQTTNAPPTHHDAPDDALLRTNLTTLAEAGLAEQDAVRLAVGFLATAIRDAWANGTCPRGVLPAMRIRSYPPAPILRSPAP